MTGEFAILPSVWLLVGPKSPARYLEQGYNSCEESGTWLKSISAVDLLQFGLDCDWWICHSPSCPSFMTLRCCECTMFGLRSLRRYLDESFKSRDELVTWLNPIYVLLIDKLVWTLIHIQASGESPVNQAPPDVILGLCVAVKDFWLARSIREENCLKGDCVGRI